MSAFGPPETPEDVELRKKAAELSNLELSLSDKELQLASLRASLHEFEFRYAAATAGLFARLDDLRAQMAERQRSLHADDDDIAREANYARERARLSAVAAEQLPRKPPRGVNTGRLKELYRLLAKRIHPDLAVDDDSRAKRVKIMADVNDAYQRGDEARLEQLLAEIELSPDAVEGTGVGIDLVRIIRKIAQVERRLAEISRELAEVVASDTHKLFAAVQEAKSKGIDYIERICATLRKEIAVAERDLHAVR